MLVVNFSNRCFMDIRTTFLLAIFSDWESRALTLIGKDFAQYAQHVKHTECFSCKIYLHLTCEVNHRISWKILLEFLNRW